MKKRTGLQTCRPSDMRNELIFSTHTKYTRRNKPIRVT